MTTDTQIKDFYTEERDLEVQQVLEEFKRMRQLADKSEVPKDLIRAFKKYQKQRSILGVNAPIHILEKLQLSIMFDIVNDDYELSIPVAKDEMEIFGTSKNKKEEIEDDKEIVKVEVDDDYEYEEDEKIIAKFKGSERLGKFLGYVNDNVAKVKIGGDSVKFRKMKVSEISPYKEE